MDFIHLAQFIQKTIKTRRVQVVQLLETNQVSSMEQYQHFMGELAALNYVSQELAVLLKRQETLDD
jgi:hypothetical protein